MAVPKETVWEIEPHTIAKHKILENYLKAWFPIICSSNSRVNYIDGFAGPGKYSKGEPGSPIIAIDVAKNHPAKLSSQINFIFIEHDEKRFEHLDNEIKSLEVPENFKTHIAKGEFHTETIQLLDYLGNDKKILAPTFAFIDPFGFSGIPFNLVERLLAIPKVEVFITFMVDSINRFIEDEKVGIHINELLGTKKAGELIKSSQNRKEDLKELYQKRLEEKARYVRYFEMCDSDNRTIYYLFFASNNELGHLKMKEAMWRVNEEGDFKFSDATDPNQIILFENNEFGEQVYDLIKEKFKPGKYDVVEIKKFVEDETGFISKHFTQAMKFAEEKEKIMVDPMKRDGNKRKAKTFPVGTLITIR